MNILIGVSGKRRFGLGARVRRSAGLLAGLICFTNPLVGREAPGALSGRFERTETHMGAAFRIVLYADDAALAESGFSAAFARVADLDRKMSDYDPESELSRLCDQSGGPAVVVSADLFAAIERSLELSRASDGAFDITIGPVVRLWRRARRTRTMPAADRLQSALDRVGYRFIELDRKTSSVKLAKPGMKLDLGGIAKGLAASEALKILKALGMPSALVAAAGDIALGDPPPGKPGWEVAIAPLAPDLPPPRVLVLKACAVSTAGDAEQFVEIDGKRYSHIVDPRTGMGVIARASVTVVAQDGATADGLDTSAFILGVDRGARLIESTQGASGLFVIKQGDTITETATAGFNAIPNLPGAAKPERIPRFEKGLR